MAGGVFDFQSLWEKVYKWGMWFTSAHSLQVRVPSSTLHLSKGVLPISSLVGRGQLTWLAGQQEGPF